MRPGRNLKHTDLFLVRFWTQEVDGEAHEFQNWDALVDTLRAMLAATSPGSVLGADGIIQPRPAEGLESKGE
ncbi:MAG: hypothetical protein M3014_13645 [Chloroflexota bacterium]|nr:hypothetical protein [Chloroflexota bacterium]